MLDVQCEYCKDAVVGLYSIGLCSTGSEALFAVSCEVVIVWCQHNLRGRYGKCCLSVHADTHSSKLPMLSCFPEFVQLSDIELCTGVLVLTNHVTAAGIMHLGRLFSALLLVDKYTY